MTRQGTMLVLGIETTCDETAAAVVERGTDGRGRILSNVVLSQVGEHAAFGGFLVKRWKLPSTLEDPIVWHHDPAQATHRPREATIVYAANRLAHRYGFGCPREEVLLENEPLFAKVRIDERALAKFDDRAPGLFEIARKIIA